MTTTGRSFLLLLSLIGSGPLLAGTLQTTDSDLAEQIGQMVMVGFRGFEVDESSPIVSDIRERKIGGVVLFEYDVPARRAVRNIQSRGQVQRLTRALQSRAETPLFIAIDQEGGRVNRLKDKYGFPPSVSAQSLGERNDPQLTRESAAVTAKTLHNLGINLNFAPVVDLNLNPENPVIGGVERSYSADPEKVIAHAAAVVAAHREAGVITALKHFPGHGSSRADSHLGFVDVTATWSEKELVPYENLINRGLCDMVMTAHIFNAGLDPEFPATLSRPILTGLLRKKLGWDGVIVSDDLQMRAISDHYGLETAIEQGVNAGLDLLVFGNNSVYEPDIARRATAILKELVHSGKISEARIRESYERLKRLKSRIGPSE